MENPLRQKRVFIIGGSSGIGFALAKKCLEEDAFVTIYGKHKSSDFLDFCTLPNANGILIDLCDMSSIDLLCNEVIAADVLCIVYGPFLQCPLDTATRDDWERIVYANLTLPGILISTVLPNMMKQHWGRILLFGGTETHILRGFKTNAVYGAAKIGVTSLVRSISMMYAKYGITANAICPGFIDTPLLTQEQRIGWAAKNPNGQLLSMDTVVSAALFLLKDSVYNGVIMPVDSGWSSFSQK
ncbi:MAG: SDR family NAD(P)-dependent oxidoreductase [Treponema sp.]